MLSIASRSLCSVLRRACPPRLLALLCLHHPTIPARMPATSRVGCGRRHVGLPAGEGCGAHGARNPALLPSSHSTRSANRDKVPPHCCFGSDAESRPGWQSLAGGGMAYFRRSAVWYVFWTTTEL